MQIAASNPDYLAREDVPVQDVHREREIIKAQALEEGKPQKVIEKMLEGRIDKFYKEHCLLEQPYIKDTDKTIQQLIYENVSKFGENISVRRFSRYEVGEGIEKVKSDFAAEVMSQLNG
jgi:elongation factor Ts